MASEIKVDTIVNAGGDNDSGIDLATNDAVKIKIANAVKAEVDSSGHGKLDTVKGYTSAASISVVGEGGSTTTNLQQGLAKCWIQFNGTGTISTQDSFNRGGLTDNGTGDYTVTYTNNMANDDYAASGIGNAAQMAINDSITTSNIRLLISNSGGTDGDVTIVTMTTHGDLA